MSLLLSLLSPVCLASFLTTSASPPRIYYCLTACDRLLLGGCLIPPVPKMVSFKAGPFMFGSCKYLRWDDTACVLSWPLFTRNYLVGRRQRAWTSPHGSHGNVHIKRQAGRNFSLRYLKSYPAGRTRSYSGSWKESEDVIAIVKQGWDVTEWEKLYFCWIWDTAIINVPIVL